MAALHSFRTNYFQVGKVFKQDFKNENEENEETDMCVPHKHCSFSKKKHMHLSWMH